MKRKYQKPAMQVVNIKIQSLLGDLGSNMVNSVGGGVFENKVEAGSGDARSRGFDDWDEE